MPSYPTYVVDAFTKVSFAGNQAAVCLIPKVLKDEEYQQIAAELRLSETAFPVPQDGNFTNASHFSLRWFTPTVEVPLCGHATLATSHVLLHVHGNASDQIKFSTKSGDLLVCRNGDNGVQMDFPQFEISSIRFPRQKIIPCSSFPEVVAPSNLHDVISCVVPSSLHIEQVAYAEKAKKLIVVLDSNTTKDQLLNLQCDHKKMVSLHPEGDFVRGLILTLVPKDPAEQGFVDGSGTAYAYACRYFAPWVGIDEDPATGSAQCALGPFWSRILGQEQLYAYQCYPGRGAQFNIEMKENGRIGLTGQSVTIIEGKINLEDPVSPAEKVGWDM